MRLHLPAKLFGANGSISRRLRMWAAWDRLCDVLENTFGPVWFAYHNAEVLRDFELRMVTVIYEATGGMMSKPYYTLDAMMEQIAAHVSASYDDAYAEGRKDVLEELALEDPNPFPDPIPAGSDGSDGA